jgi:succinyl-diaminopimelate desuccinylase
MFAPLLLAAALTSKVALVERQYERADAKRLVPLLTDVIRFPTVQGDVEARKAQQEWLRKTAAGLGLDFRDAGLISEIELPGPAGAPVLGLMVHGDVQPVDADSWSFGPFQAKVQDGAVWGRGSADDKGPLVQALLAMHALKESGVKRTHTIRLLVGSDEESDNLDVKTYLESHQPPDYTLVLDSGFPVIAGEKAWNSLTVATPIGERGAPSTPYTVAAISAGLATSIVPDHAEVTLKWTEGTPEWSKLEQSLRAFTMPEGTRVAMKANDEERTLRIVAYGKSAHAGVNLEGGRNALVALARLLDGKLPRGGAGDLLAFARLAGQDLHGTGLGITDSDPLWGRYAVNVATIKIDPDDAKKTMLTINLRRIPPRTGPQFEAAMKAFVQKFNEQRGAGLTSGGFWADEPLAFNPKGKLVRRLLADYAAATGEKNPKPAISGGGTYAKRLPRAIAFGMWFPDKPYPGHDVDEKNPIDDLQRGTRVLIRALTDIATGARIGGAFQP